MFWQLLAGWLNYAKAYLNHKSNDYEIGQGLVEYALILIMVSTVMVLLLTILGPGIRNVFENILFNIEEGTS